MRKQIVASFPKKREQIIKLLEHILKIMATTYIRHVWNSIKNPPKCKNIIFDTTLLLYYIITIAVLLMHYNGKQYIGYWQQWLNKLITCKTWTVSTVLWTMYHVHCECERKPKWLNTLVICTKSDDTNLLWKQTNRTGEEAMQRK